MSTLAPELSDRRLQGDDADFVAARPGMADAVQRSMDNEFHSLGLTLGYHDAASSIVAGEPAGKAEAPPPVTDCRTGGSVPAGPSMTRRAGG
jgi:hypothetical protein